MPTAEYRERVLELAARRSPSEGETALRVPEEYGGDDDVGGVDRRRSRRSRYGDLSLLVKVGVQFGLFGGAVLHLGTEQHHDALPAPTSPRSSCRAASR